MPLIIRNGGLLRKGTQLAASQTCCCACPLGVCQITIEFLDENSCEDDVFDLYLKNPTTSVERFIQTVDLKSDPPGGCGTPGRTYANIHIPVTVTPTDFDSDCKVIIGLRYVSPNCCDTYARFRIRRPNGCLLYGSYFGQAGLETTYTWLELCNDDPCPPPPPKPCCSKITQCENTIVVRKCGAYSYQECCSSNADNNEDAATYCSGEDPPVTTCEIGLIPANNAPYDCLNNAYQGGVWVTIQGWNSFPGDRSIFTAAEQEILDWLDANVNGTFWVPFTCLAKRTSYNLPDLFKETGSCTGLWERFVSVDMCNRTASFNFNYYSGCSPFDTIALSIDVGPKPQSEIPCNDFLGCSCEGFSDNPVWPVGEGANGQISVGVE